MLKIWNDVFDIQGVGVDICNEFIEIGKKRQRDIDKIELYVQMYLIMRTM